MKLKKKYDNAASTVDYKLDTKDGQFSQSSMPAKIAEEIAQRADAVELGEEKGFEIVVNGEMLFPQDIFDFDDGEIEGLKPKRSGRPTKDELLKGNPHLGGAGAANAITKENFDKLSYDEKRKLVEENPDLLKSFEKSNNPFMN